MLTAVRSIKKFKSTKSAFELILTTLLPQASWGFGGNSCYIKEAASHAGPPLTHVLNVNVIVTGTFTCRLCGNWVTEGKNGRHLSGRVMHVLVIARTEQGQTLTLYVHLKKPEWQMFRSIPWPLEPLKKMVLCLTVDTEDLWWSGIYGEVATGESSDRCMVTFHSGWHRQESSERDRTTRWPCVWVHPAPVLSPSVQRVRASAVGD